MSNRGTWNIEKKSGASYVSDCTVYRPNSQFQLNLMSTANKIRLADGSQAFILPETKSVKESLTLEWLDLDFTDSLITKLQGYINNGDYVRITTHQSDTLIGRFISLSRVWLTEAVADKLDIQCVLDRIE